MGRKSKTYNLLYKFIGREDDNNIEEKIKELVCNLQTNKDPLLQLSGDAIQSVNGYWYLKFEELFNKNHEEWLDENKEKNLEIDKRQLFQETAEMLTIYMPFYKIFSEILTSNKNMIIDEIKTEYELMQKNNSIFWENRSSELTIEEIKLLKTLKIKKFNRVSAFVILCHRFKNDKDFPIKIDLTNMDNIMDQFDKFIKQFYKSPFSKNLKIQ